MNRHLKKVRIAVVLGVILALIMSSMSITYAASGTKSMTAYKQVIVKGKYAYCAANTGIYKVNLNTGSKKRLVKHTDAELVGLPDAMKIHKGYLYYIIPNPVNGSLYRIKLNGTNKKFLARIESGYAISDGKIYYTTYNYDSGKRAKWVMKLNGKSKKKSSYDVNQYYRTSNKSNYRVEQVFVRNESVYDSNYGEYYDVQRYKDCLKTPSGKSIKLCTYTYVW